jgi:hypothetical protein
VGLVSGKAPEPFLVRGRSAYWNVQAPHLRNRLPLLDRAGASPNRVHMVALYTTWYNFTQINSAVRMTPAMAARLTDRLWDVGDIVKLVEGCESANETNSSGAVS